MLHQAALTGLIWLGFIFASLSTLAALVAIIAPKSFIRLAGFWGTWVETEPTFPIVDHRVNIDSFVLRFPRAFGAFVLVAALFWWAMLLHVS